LERRAPTLFLQLKNLSDITRLATPWSKASGVFKENNQTETDARRRESRHQLLVFNNLENNKKRCIDMGALSGKFVQLANFPIFRRRMVAVMARL
jgi:hypothetical protein